jgi:hypothetical protein
MQIESGTTSWWRNRHLVYVGVLLAFTAWFGYDGFYAWPAENAKLAAEAMGVAPETVHINPKVMSSVQPRLLADVEELNKLGSLTLEQVVARLKVTLGEPTLVRTNEYWWVGPAMYIKASVQNNRPKMEEVLSDKRSEGSIRGQRWLSMALLVGAVLVTLKLVRVMTTRVILDDAGLRYNRRSVSWEAMTGLRSDDYERKFWVDLEYTAGDVTRSMRLDSLHIEKFNEIVRAICERKGFTSPLKAAEPKKDDAEQGGPSGA